MQQTRKKKYKTKHDWVGKLIHRELSKRENFDQKICAKTRIHPIE